MKKLNNIAPVLVMMALLVFGTSAANANDGIIIRDLAGNETQTCVTDEKSDWGIIIHDFVGIIIRDLTGIEVGETKTSTQTNCGIIIRD